MKSTVYSCKKYFRSVTALFLLFIIYTLPIILADRLYADDLSRSLIGETGWITDGRPLTEIIIRLMNFGRPVTDMSPLPLFVGLLTLALCLVIYLEHVTSELPVSESATFRISDFLKCIILLPVILNPFLLHILSLKFDGVTILLSLSLPFMAFSLTDSDIPISSRVGRYVVFTLFNLVIFEAVFCLFQPSIGICLSMCFLELFFMWMKHRIDLKVIFARLSALFFSVLIYLPIIAAQTVDTKGWRAEASQISTGFTQIVSDVLINYRRIWRQIVSYCNELTKPIILLYSVYIILSVYGIIRFIFSSKVSGSVSFKTGLCIYSLLLPFILLVTGFLPLTFLKNLPVSPHVLVTVSVPLLYFGLLLIFAPERFQIPLVIVALLCFFYSYSLSYTYGNALDSQEEYEKYIIYNVASDIEKAEIKKDYDEFSIIGNISRAPEVQMIGRKYPYIAGIVPVYLYNENWIGAAPLYHYLQYPPSLTDITDEDRAIVKNSEPISESSLYSIYENGNKLLIVF